MPPAGIAQATSTTVGRDDSDSISIPQVPIAHSEPPSFREQSHVHHAPAASFPTTDPEDAMPLRRSFASLQSPFPSSTIGSSAADRTSALSSPSSAPPKPGVQLSPSSPAIPQKPSLNSPGLAVIATRSSSVPFAFMGQGFSRAPPPASPPLSSSSSVSVASKGFQAALASGSKLKRAIVNRRKKSEDVSPLFGFGTKRGNEHDARPPGQEQQSRHLRVGSCMPLASSVSLPSSKGKLSLNSSNPTALMAADHLLPLMPPPSPPPKSYPLHQQELAKDASVSRPSHTLEQVPTCSQSLDVTASVDNRSSIIPLTPGITHAVTLMCMNEIQNNQKEQSMPGVKSKAESREVDGGQNQSREKSREADPVKRDSMTAADIREARRKSDSTMSYQTIRPGTTSSRTSRPVSMAESLQSNHTAKPVRLSALLTDADFTMLEEDDDSCRSTATQDAVTTSTPSTTVLLPQRRSPEAPLKTKSRRSLSLNFSPYSSSRTQPSPPPLPPLPPLPSHHPSLSLSGIKYPSYPATEGMPPVVPPAPSAAKESLTTAEMSAASQTGPVLSPRLQVGQNLRGKLSSWTNPSLSERKLPVLPPQMQHPTALSASSSHPPQALRAISMTGSLAPAAGRALRGAVGRMGRAIGITSSPSNSAPASGPASDGQILVRTNSNQSSSAGPYSPMGWGKRRTPDAPSGSWSIAPSVDSASVSDIDHLGVPSAPTLGPMLRPPFKGSGIVFGKELRNAVNDTGVGVMPSSGEGRHVWEREGDPDTTRKSTMYDEGKVIEERRLPAVILRCAQHLLVWGIQEEGLFRVGGRPKHITTLRSEFDKGADYDLAACEPGDLDPHAVGSVFKAFFRELPEHMLTAVLHPYFEGIVEQETATVGAAAGSKPRNADVNSAGHGPGLPSGPNFPATAMKKPPSLSTLGIPSFKDMPPPSNSLIRAIRALISQLPEENQDLLRTLVDVINATAKNEKATKMPIANLVLVFYPSVQITPPLLRVLCETREIWDEERKAPVVDAKGEDVDRRMFDIYSDAPDGLEERDSLHSESHTSEDHTSSLSDYQASAEESIDLREELVRRRPSPRARRNPESTVYMDAECGCSSSASLLLHSEPSNNVFLSSNQCPNMPSPSSTPPMTSSVESLVTPETSSGPSLPHLPMDENGKPVTEQDVESMSDGEAPESTKYIISDLSPLTGPVQFPALPVSLPSSPLKRRSTPLLSLPPHITPVTMPPSTAYEPPSPTTSSHSNSSLSRRLKMKKPSLQLFLSAKRSNNSLKSVSKSSISNPISNNDSTTVLQSASDSSVSVPQSTVTAPQGNVYILPPVVKTPHENSSLGLALGIEVKPADEATLSTNKSNNEKVATLETGKAGTPIADRYRTNSTASSVFSMALSTIEQGKQRRVNPVPRRPAISTSSNHLGLLDKELGGGDDWTRSVLLAADIEHNWTQGERR
ncbi:hypothetical protein AX15_003466 [Amanita polypyramis BW_CC]|nr:hypothetical protein AX15_003466 [Amanita polypyramis BW_CC]